MPNQSPEDEYAGYALNIFEPVLQGSRWTANLTSAADNWKRSIVRMGGFWEGGFKLRETRGYLEDFFYTQLGAHLEEKYAGAVTWEGFVGEMDTPARDRDGWYMDVSVFGYSHTLPFRYVSIGDETTGNASIWVDEIITADCEYVTARAISTNTLQVLRSNKNKPRAWDELKRIAELGDGTGAPWVIRMDPGRRFVYQAEDTSVQYYVRGGVRRRRSLFQTFNYVSGSYVGTDEETHDITPASTAESIRRFGRIEERLYRDGMPSTAAEALRDTYLKENSYPWPRPVGTDREVKLFNSVGDQVGVSPWVIKPGIVRDLGYSIGGSDYGGWLADQRDIMVDEVVASKKGVSLRTWLFEEADLMETQFSYAAETYELDYDLRD
ncbi:MAG: hypothetical protein ACOYYS_10035 [Chloroflexota bacterium]